MRKKIELSNAGETWIRITIFDGFFSSVEPPPIKYFMDYLSFSDERPLVLPRHLQFPIKSEPTMEIDVPRMIKNEPFIGLIKGIEKIRYNNVFQDACSKGEFDTIKTPREIEKKKKELEKKSTNLIFDELEKEIKKGYFDIIKYLVIEENKLFITEFENKYKSINFDENVPELFFSKINYKSNIIQFNPEKESFIWDSSEISEHEGNIIKISRHFMRMVYTIGAFKASGIYEGKEN